MFSKIRSYVAGLASTALMLSACARLPPTETPIPTIEATRTNASGRTLIVMLPGMGDRAETFVTEEFMETAREHDFDAIAVDAHFAYYRERSLVTRIREDVVAPAQAKGYENIWFLGISMGGFGALLYTQAHPTDVNGVILLAPWLGGDKIVSDVRSADSLGTWDPDGKDFPAHEIDVWRWLQAETVTAGGAPIVLAYGDSDRLAGAYAPLLDVIPDANTYTRTGNHKWTTWRPLWAQIAAELEPGRRR